jgi:prepilin-type N-terminal cleavage/methylation domain-containing protein
MKKNGFTLVELIAVIAIMAILVIIVAPNVVKIFNTGVDKNMEEQEKFIESAAKIFARDYCESVSLSGDISCPYSYIKCKATGVTCGEHDQYLCLSDLQKAGLVDEKINHKGNDCTGFIEFNASGNTKVYLYCGETYKTNKDVINKCN